MSKKAVILKITLNNNELVSGHSESLAAEALHQGGAFFITHSIGGMALIVSLEAVEPMPETRKSITARFLAAFKGDAND